MSDLFDKVTVSKTDRHGHVLVHADRLAKLIAVVEAAKLLHWGNGNYDDLDAALTALEKGLIPMPTPQDLEAIKRRVANGSNAIPGDLDVAARMIKDLRADRKALCEALSTRAVTQPTREELAGEYIQRGRDHGCPFNDGGLKEYAEDHSRASAFLYFLACEAPQQGSKAMALYACAQLISNLSKASAQ